MGNFYSATIKYTDKFGSPSYHDILFFSRQPITKLGAHWLDIGVESSIRNMRQHLDFEKFQKRLARNMRNFGISLIGEMMGGVKDYTGGDFQVWVSDEVVIPAELKTVPAGTPTDLPKEMNDVYGGPSLILSEGRGFTRTHDIYEYDRGPGLSEKMAANFLGQFLCVDLED
jgi:hypothetical protein